MKAFSLAAIAALAAAVTIAPVATALPSATPVIALHVLAQQETADPFLEQVNAELGRQDAEPESQSPAAPETDTRSAFYYLRVFSALCLVIALILAVGYAVRRAAGRTPLLAGSELGRVLGRLYLNRNTTLFFIETGGQVLLIGVTGQSVSTLGQFDASVFREEEAETPSSDFDPESFLAQLNASSESMRHAHAPREEDDMMSLRRDIQRLQDYLREESRETSD